MRVVYVGTGAIGLPAYEALAGSSHEIVAVVTQPDRPAGRGLELKASPIKQAALRRHHWVFQPERINQESAVEQLRHLAPDVMVVCAYGQILRPAVLGIPRLGCLNLHASLLPRHRGASCIQAAILAGDTETGMTLMWMDEGLDTGDILLQNRVGIGPEETAGELHDRLAAIAAPLLLDGLSLLEKGQAPRHAQESSLATYAPRLSRDSGALDWSRSAAEIARQVRAMNPWPGTFTHWQGEGRKWMIKIWRAQELPAVEGAIPGKVLEVIEAGVRVACGTGSLLVTEMQVEGRSRLSASACARGLRLQTGHQLGV